jgi:hypothetical protein
VNPQFRPSNTVAAIPPNRLYLIGYKDLLASSQPFAISQPNFPCPQEPALLHNL